MPPPAAARWAITIEREARGVWCRRRRTDRGVLLERAADGRHFASRDGRSCTALTLFPRLQCELAWFGIEALAKFQTFSRWQSQVGNEAPLRCEGEDLEIFHFSRSGRFGSLSSSLLLRWTRGLLSPRIVQLFELIERSAPITRSSLLL